VRADLCELQMKRRAEDSPPYLFAFTPSQTRDQFARVDLPVREKLPHTIPQWVADGSWFFITINCVPPGKNQLAAQTLATPCSMP